MAYIKKLVIQGFKSFARRTEIVFENSMNVIVGPNGSGKSNITDALCFVLGRLSIKSIRAAKSANLLFSGNKIYKASGEAFVELVFDNSNRSFSLETNEVSIKRVVRKNGQSVYKINNEVKTRQELLELLAQAGIDPNGFNIVLQGEIASIVKMNSEERRKIIEEVAGISVYETRKQKSLDELNKTEEKLKEVSAILRERNSYLKNLERERQEALNFQKLEETVKRCKATILKKSITEKESEVWGCEKLIENQSKEIEKIRKQTDSRRAGIDEIREKINKINRMIQDSTSNEQELLHREIAELKATLAGESVKKDNFEARIEENKDKEKGLKEKNKNLQVEISQIKTSSPEIKKQQERLKEAQERADILEKQRRKFYNIKSELSTLENKKQELENSEAEMKKEAEFATRTISLLFEEIKHEKTTEKSAALKQKTRVHLEEINEKLTNLDKANLAIERENAVLEQEIPREERLKSEIVKLDICPLCKSKVTKEHIAEVIQNSNNKINHVRKKIDENNSRKEKMSEEFDSLRKERANCQQRINEIEIDMVKIKNADEKKEQIKRISDSQSAAKKRISELAGNIGILRKEFDSLKNIEERYDEMKLKIQELSFADIDVDTEVSIKQMSAGRISVELKSIARDNEESEEELKKINVGMSEKGKVLQKKEQEEQKLYERFNKLFSEKNEMQDREKTIETEIIGLQHTARTHEDKINSIKIQKAQLSAQLESLNSEFSDFERFELIDAPIEQVKERLQKSQFKISEIGSVNLRALEVYEKVQEQCTLIEEKANVIIKEKEKIGSIIAEIDKKKKKSFMRTLDSVNQFFSRNFSQLSRKGEVTLELDNPQDPFAGGLDIRLKVARGKFFDIASLSGGEKTLVALSLIFAIQEYKPYYFYIFDEIDAALDKHNSERLAALVKKYMLSGQYIIITHNDALISEATTLYGVSMQENISKVVSLKV